MKIQKNVEIADMRMLTLKISHAQTVMIAFAIYHFPILHSGKKNYRRPHERIRVHGMV